MDTGDATGYKEMGDHALMEICKQGDLRAFEVIYNRHRGRLFNYGWKFCGDRSIAEDAVQKTFVYLHGKITSYRPDAPLTALLFKVMKSKCLTLIKKKKKEVRTFLG